MEKERLLWIVSGEARIRALVAREGGDWRPVSYRMADYILARPDLVARAYRHDPGLVDEVWEALMREAFVVDLSSNADV